MKSFLCLLILCLSAAAFAVPGDDLPAALTLPRAKRPAWVREQGIVMAGSWEPLLYRVRRDDFDNKDHKTTLEQRRLYNKEHSREMLLELKKLGVNFIMGHCYKAFGLDAEKEDMQEAARFAELCHKEGFRVGVYTFSGTLGWEILRNECPESKDWEVLDCDRKPIPYSTLTYRHFFNRNNKDAQAYLRKVVDFAVNDIKTDLIHLDNYSIGPGYDPLSLARFREYLARYYTPEEIGIRDFCSALPSKLAYMDGTQGYVTLADAASLGNETEKAPGQAVIDRAWTNFSCQSLAESYYDVSRYARSLRPDILMECNTCAFGERITIPTDHGRIFRYGEAFWDEGIEPAFEDGRITSRQIVYKTGQTMDNIVFVYIRNPLQAAESLAFNTDCLGCILQFEYGKITVPSGAPMTKTVSPEILPYVTFFHEQRPYYRDATRLPDVAVLRSFASQRLCSAEAWQATHRFEQYCIENSIPWALIFDQHTANLKKYKALCLVGAEALSNEQVARIRKFAKNGGGLVLTEETGKYDEKMTPRTANPFADLGGPRVVRVKADIGEEEAVVAISQACGGSLKLSLQAPPHLVGEVTEQAKARRRLVHLVNYKPDAAVERAVVTVEAPGGRKVKRVAVIRPEAPAPESIPFTQTRDKVNFVVPGVGVYALVSVETR